MTYDLEKYRDKREKVLGVRKRGISFQAMATVVSAVILLGFGLVVVPKSIAYFTTRNQDDAIYKLAEAEAWPAAITSEVSVLDGVKAATLDSFGARLVITYDREVIDSDQLTFYFKSRGMKTVLLNHAGH